MNSKPMKSILLCAIFLISQISLIAQSPYEFNWKKETGYLAVGGISTGLGFYFRGKTPLFTPDELITLNKQDINAFDRIATGNNSVGAGHASDIFWSGSHILPLLFLANKKTRTDFGTIAGLYGEVFFINSGLTLLSKNTFRRPRPFVFNDEVDITGKLKPNAKTAFVSGHTSFTAANSFFAAKVFSDYYPDSRFKSLVWGLAITIPAATGYFRVAAGRHYPTDVIAGYVLGAAIGYLVPHWHRKKTKDNGLTFYGGMNGALLRYRF